jgi:hypothetical protein
LSWVLLIARAAQAIEVRLARSIANDTKGNSEGKTQAAAEKRAEKFLKHAVKILTAVKDAGTEGTTGEKLAPLVGLKELKGLGPIAAAMKNVLLLLE